MRANLRQWINGIGWCALFLTAGGAAAFFFGLDRYSAYQFRAERYDLSAVSKLPERSAIFDLDGNLYSYIDGENRLTIPLKDVPSSFINALRAREDARFRTHSGVDYEGIARAAIANLRAGAIRQGGSTITQQLARNAFNLTGKSLDRKALEALLAQRIEKQYSKEQILEFYVNRIYFGSGFYGIEAASRGYFGKPAAQLSLAESATLAALVCSPNRLAPTKNPEAAERERNELIDRMGGLGLISREDAASAKASPLRVSKKSNLAIHDDYIVDAINRELAQLLTSDVIDYGGLKIYSTIDVGLQRNAQLAADRRLTEIERNKHYAHPRKEDFVPGVDSQGREKPTNYLQAAVVVVDNATGAVRAIVGGRDYSHSHYPRATLAKRQIGSTFKSFVYATAFERGLLPTSLVDDSPIDPDAFRAISEKWSPKNSDGQYLGYQRADVGLLKSRNTMTVRIGQMVGLPLMKRVGDALNIGDSIQNYPVTFLGGFETTLRDLTAAYTVFPNHGVFRRSHLISKIEDHEGNAIYVDKTAPRRIFSPEAAWMTNSILQQVMKTGTAAKAASLGWKKPAGGKTGTTDEFRDAWFVGYTSSLTCGVWVGMDHPETIMEKGYGSALALPVWVDVMNSTPDLRYPADRLEPGTQLQRMQICSASGRRATSQCSFYCAVTTEVLPASRSAQPCNLHPNLAPIAEYAPPAAPAGVYPTQTPRPLRSQPSQKGYDDDIVTQDQRFLRQIQSAPQANALPENAGTGSYQRRQDPRVSQQPRYVIQYTARGVRIWNVPPEPLSPD
jgi:penicillin-binding protein 1A